MSDDFLEENEVAQHVSNLWTAYAECGGVPIEDLEILEEAYKEIKELHASFQSHWKASQRAIKMWQDKTGKKATWPDHAKLCVFLMEEIENTRAPQAQGVDVESLKITPEIIQSIHMTHGVDAAAVCMVYDTIIDHLHEQGLLGTQTGDLSDNLDRQCDNMAYVLNHVELPDNLYEKFTRELTEDRGELAQVCLSKTPKSDKQSNLSVENDKQDTPNTSKALEALKRLLSKANYYPHDTKGERAKDAEIISQALERCERVEGELTTAYMAGVESMRGSEFPKGWQPIETAPKDGTDIIGAKFVGYRDERFDCVRLWWQPEFDNWIAGCREMVLANGLTFENGKNTELHSPEIYNPSHWMPLPAAPKEKS